MRIFLSDMMNNHQVIVRGKLCGYQSDAGKSRHPTHQPNGMIKITTKSIEKIRKNVNVYLMVYI